MKDNLEGIPFNAVTGKNGISYAGFRESLTPRYATVAWDISKGWGWLIVSLAVLCFWGGKQQWNNWWLILPGSLLTGYIAAYLALFIHEASHYNLCADRKKNDRIATLLLCLPFGLSLKSYRKIHWQHHLHLGTPADTEISYFNALSPLFILETLTGIHLLRTMFSKEKNNVLTPEQASESRIMLLSGALLHALLLTFLVWSGFYIAAISWALGFGVCFPFFASLRQLLEHRDELAKAATDFKKQPHGKISRLFYHTLLSSTFGAAGFTRHLIHHWDPQLSYTRMKDAEQFLEQDERTASILKSSRTRYTTVFRKLFNKT